MTRVTTSSRTGGNDGDTPDIYVTFVSASKDGQVPAGVDDLDFIAAARQDIPRLVDEIRRLRADR